MKLLARGTLAGLVGTALMTAAMLPSKKASMSPGKVAPRQITENLLNRLRVRRHLSRPAFDPFWRDSCSVWRSGPWGIAGGFRSRGSILRRPGYPSARWEQSS
jgi:hypothetical protein